VLPVLHLVLAVIFKKNSGVFWERSVKKEKKEAFGEVYSMPHFLTTFTIMKITRATMMKVISAIRKSPMVNI
jgi:hypothetical protein